MSLDGKSQTKFKIKTIRLGSNLTCMNQTLHAKERHEANPNHLQFTIYIYCHARSGALY